jgi:hypothetical protein
MTLTTRLLLAAGSGALLATLVLLGLCEALGGIRSVPVAVLPLFCLFGAIGGYVGGTVYGRREGRRFDVAVARGDLAAAERVRDGFKQLPWVTPGARLLLRTFDGTLLIAREQWEEALEAYAPIIDSAAFKRRPPFRAIALNNAAWCLVQLRRDAGRAVAWAEEAVRLASMPLRTNCEDTLAAARALQAQLGPSTN